MARKWHKKEKKKHQAEPTCQTCSSAQLISIRTYSTEQDETNKNMLRYTFIISIRHKHQTTLPTSTYNIYIWKKTKHNIEICLISGSNIPPSQKPVHRHYVDLTQGLIIPTWRSAINLSFMMLNCPQNSLISMTSSHILWFLTVHTCNLWPGEFL